MVATVILPDGGRNLFNFTLISVAGQPTFGTIGPEMLAAPFPQRKTTLAGDSRAV